mgnify:FL=1
MVALADIVKVAAMHRVTDTYGPIPYLNISSGDINKAYDPQQAVYKRFTNTIHSLGFTAEEGIVK